MKVIYKYPFPISDKVEIKLPYNSRVLTIQEQDNRLFLWAIIDNEEQSFGKRTFYVFGTGNPIKKDFIENLKHIATVQASEFVWHIFE